MPTDFNYSQSHAMIIHTCQLPYYQLYDLKRSGDLYRNRDQIGLFEGADVLTIDEITPRFAAMKEDDGYSQAFEARRAGEVIKWAVDRGLAEECTHDNRTAWRILDREMKFMAIGPAKNQRVIRIRGLGDPVALVEANKLANREYGQRERARRKRVEGIRKSLVGDIDRILRVAPDLALAEGLERFRVHPATTFAEARRLIEAAAGDDDGSHIMEIVAKTAGAVQYEHELKRRQAAREQLESIQASLPDDDADALGSINF